MVFVIRLLKNGRQVITVYKLKLSEDEAAYYSQKSINKLFAILGIFEECEEDNDMSTFHTYLDRLILEFSGVKDVFDICTFISIVGILSGLRDKEQLTHKEVKSIVFHCISLVKKGIDNNELL